MEFPESSGKTSHTVSHSSSILVKSVCRLAWKQEVVNVIEALIDQCVGRSVGGRKAKGLNMVYKLAALLCLWELTDVEKQQMSETWERNMYRHAQTQNM